MQQRLSIIMSFLVKSLNEIKPRDVSEKFSRYMIAGSFSGTLEMNFLQLRIKSTRET